MQLGRQAQIAAFMALAIVLTCGRLLSFAHADQTLEQSSIFGCWEDERAKETKNPDGSVFAGSHLVCFNKEGVMSGVTFDAGDGWDWNQPYLIQGNTILTACIGQNGEWERCRYFTISKIDSSGMDVEMDGKEHKYSLVCRSEAEDVQCERWKETIEQPAGEGSK